MDPNAVILIALAHAEGELQASGTLAEAARVIGTQPATLQLRYLQTLAEIGVEKNTTVVFPIPLELFRPMIEASYGARPPAPAEDPA